MRISQINSVYFGHKLVIDSGASNQQKGSLKIALISDNGEEKHAFNSVVCPDGFKEKDDYLKGITDRVYEMYDEFSKSGKKLVGKDKNLNGIMVYAPGATKGNIAQELANLHLESGGSLQDIDYNKLPKLLKRKLAQTEIHIQKKLRFAATNDMIGTGTAILLDIFKNRPKTLTDGYRASFLMAGGGLGTGDIEVLGKQVYIKSTECGSTHASGSGSHVKTLETVGASSTALIKNFANALGFSTKDINKLVATGNARIVTENAISPSKESEIKALRGTGLFAETNIDGKPHFTLMNITEAARIKARKAATNSFINALAQISSNKLLEGVNEMIITGPLTKAISNSMKTSPKSFIQLLEERTLSYLSLQGQSMNRNCNFRFIDNILVENNTQGGVTALTKGKFVGGDLRGNWLRIPINLLKQAV